MSELSSSSVISLGRTQDVAHVSYVFGTQYQDNVTGFDQLVDPVLKVSLIRIELGVTAAAVDLVRDILT